MSKILLTIIKIILFLFLLFYIKDKLYKNLKHTDTPMHTTDNTESTKQLHVIPAIAEEIHAK
jgi:hypothetical protein